MHNCESCNPIHAADGRVRNVRTVVLSLPNRKRSSLQARLRIKFHFDPLPSASLVVACNSRLCRRGARGHRKIIDNGIILQRNHKRHKYIGGSNVFYANKFAKMQRTVVNDSRVRVVRFCYNCVAIYSELMQLSTCYIFSIYNIRNKKK